MQTGTSKATKESYSTFNQKRKNAKKTRKVQFADPLAEQRLYDRAASPITETKAVTAVKVNQPPNLAELEPPFSLVAQLDLAARKMNARQVMKSVEDNLAMKTTKSLKSLKSTVSIKGSKNS